MAISRFAASRLTQGLPKYQSAWDQDNVEQGALVPIASGVITTQGTNQIQFANIPQIYQHLMIITNFRSTAVASTEKLYIYTSNTSVGNFSSTILSATSSSISSTRVTNDYYGSECGLTPAASSPAGVFGSSETHILNYVDTSNHRSAITKSSCNIDGPSTSQIVASLCRGTGAINYITMFVYGNSGNLAPGSNATLYGIKASA